MTDTSDSPQPARCLIIGRQQTLHLLDESRSTPSSKWSKCSWPPASETTVVLLSNARQRFPNHVPCDECFPGRVLPGDPSTPAR